MAKKKPEGEIDLDADDGKKSGLLSKLPIGGLLSGIGDTFANISLSLRSLTKGNDKSMTPLLLLGGGVLVLVMILILLFVVLGNSLSAPPVASNRTSGTAEKTTVQPHGDKTASQGIRPDEQAKSVRGTEAVETSINKHDPFLSQPILPDEPQFMLQGEIGYGRTPQKYWSLSDIRPGWQDLSRLYKTMLREHNSTEFYKMLGLEAPALDRY